MSGNHETEFAKYYLGISGPDKDRNSALNTALSNALEKAGVESSSIYIESVRKNISNSTTQQKVGDWRTSITGNSNSETFGETKKRFSSTIDKITLVEEYWDGNIGYALIRIPKTGYDSFNFHDWNVRENRKRKLMGGVRSAVLPGWGSFYQEKPFRGTMFLLGTIASAGIIYNSKNEYNRSINLMNSSIIGSDKQRFYDQSNKHLEEYNIGLISLSTIYVSSVLDPIIFPGEYRDYYYVKARRIKTSSFVSNKKRMLTISIWFDPGMQVDLLKVDINPLGFFRHTTGISDIGLWEYLSFPQLYAINFNFEQDEIQGFEFGISVQQLLVNSNFLGINPYITFDLGWQNFFQDWDGAEEFAQQYDLGRGLSSSTVKAYDVNYRIEVGLNRWIGRFNFFTGLSYRPEKSTENWYVNVYNGETNEDGEEKTDHVYIDSTQLPYPEVKIGGTSYAVGISFGL